MEMALTLAYVKTADTGFSYYSQSNPSGNGVEVLTSIYSQEDDKRRGTIR